MNLKARWAGLVCHTHPYYTASDCQTVSGKILGYQPEHGIDGNGRKDFEDRKVLRREWKTPREMTSMGPGSDGLYNVKHNDGEELGDDDVPD